MAEEQIQGERKEHQGAHFEEGTMRKHAAGGAAAKGNDRTARMGTGPIPKLVLEFAIPSIVGMLVNGAYNVIDSIFLGQAMGGNCRHAANDHFHGVGHAYRQRWQCACRTALG